MKLLRWSALLACCVSCRSDPPAHARELTPDLAQECAGRVPGEAACPEGRSCQDVYGFKLCARTCRIAHPGDCKAQADCYPATTLPSTEGVCIYTALKKRGEACNDSPCVYGLECLRLPGAVDFMCLGECSPGSSQCSDGETCLAASTTRGGVCWPGAACAPWTASCAADQVCVDYGFCERSGGLGAGSTCFASFDCAAGEVCLGDPATARYFCEQACDASNGLLASGAACDTACAATSSPGLGVCPLKCDALGDGTDCGNVNPELGCYPLGERDLGACVARGLQAQGAPCSSVNDCAQGLACSGSKCLKVCKVGAAGCTRCVAPAGTTIGACAD